MSSCYLQHIIKNKCCSFRYITLSNVILSRQSFTCLLCYLLHVMKNTFYSCQNITLSNVILSRHSLTCFLCNLLHVRKNTSCSCRDIMLSNVTFSRLTFDLSIMSFAASQEKYVRLIAIKILRYQTSLYHVTV